ncbi:hypothetical protein BGW38_003040 [Lunasporangiospora selenospora]|uniref:Uncharacterized protein n=1 Tax=Lunasporangiospora selenospora TaxID=979761 RepID=A0A9P6FR70_9FUNG|nr:hypothetical protein BGW38_003040 [Lunasporangiospora selenospora]
MAEIGARFATSKCHTLSDLQTITTFGFRGEAAIAAIAELSLLDIVSKPSMQDRPHSVILKDDESVIALVIDTLVNFLERQNLLSRTAAVSLRSGFRTKKRPLKSGYSFSSTETLSGIDFVPYAKYSRPSSTGTSRFNVDRLPGDSQGEELDIEDELEFELDRDLLLSEISKDSLEAAFESQPRTVTILRIEDLGTGCSGQVGQSNVFNRTNHHHSITPNFTKQVEINYTRQQSR